MDDIISECTKCKNTFTPDKCSDKEGPYVYLNFRGAIHYVRRDTVTIVPYLNLLVNGPMKNSPRDEKGYLILDENPNMFFYVIDKYREWLELDNPNSFPSDYMSKRGLCISVAKRMSFDNKFIEALRNKTYTIFNKDDLYSCYYCHLIFARGEKSASKECRYHSVKCACLPRRINTCTRLPYHSEVKIDIAIEPRPIV
jgi:hypothetical protein